VGGALGAPVRELRLTGAWVGKEVGVLVGAWVGKEVGVLVGSACVCRHERERERERERESEVEWVVSELKIISSRNTPNHQQTGSTPTQTNNETTCGGGRRETYAWNGRGHHGR
jgi:hypothetical protein